MYVYVRMCIHYIYVYIFGKAKWFRTKVIFFKLRAVYLWLPKFIFRFLVTCVTGTYGNCHFFHTKGNNGLSMTWYSTHQLTVTLQFIKLQFQSNALNIALYLVVVTLFSPFKDVSIIQRLSILLALQAKETQSIKFNPERHSDTNLA